MFLYLQFYVSFFAALSGFLMQYFLFKHIDIS